ncbi:MAG: hypothetical protein NC336_09695, partial [Clostridium sp.]|nr:hypothetical protein [Clostridium sp.]
MPKIKLSQIATNLNIGVPTVLEFLRKNGFDLGENPNHNTRVEERAYEMLLKEYSPIRSDKRRSEQPAGDRQQPQKKDTKQTPATEPAAQSEDAAPRKPGLKVVGRVDVTDRNEPARPIAPSKPEPAPSPEPAPKPAVEKAPEPVAPVTEPAPAPKKEDTPRPAEPKAEKAPEHSGPDNKTTDKKDTTPNNVTNQKPNNPSQPAETKLEATNTAPAEKPAEPEIFTLGTSGANRPTISVVGKIDLSALNQSTRPRKRSRDDRRGGQRQGG